MQRDDEEGGFMIGIDKRLGIINIQVVENQDPCLNSMTLVCIVLLVRMILYRYCKEDRTRNLPIRVYAKPCKKNHQTPIMLS